MFKKYFSYSECLGVLIESASKIYFMSVIYVPHEIHYLLFTSVSMIQSQLMDEETGSETLNNLTMVTELELG